MCKKDFKPFSHSKFQLVKISYLKWLALIKLFELSVSAKVASEQTQTSYKTALKAFDAMWFSILEEFAKTDAVLGRETETDEAYFDGKRKGNCGRGIRNKTIVFGILERNGKVSVDIADVSAKTLLASTVEKIKKEVSCIRTSGEDTTLWCSQDTIMCQLIITQDLQMTRSTSMGLRDFAFFRPKSVDRKTLVWTMNNFVIYPIITYF